MHKQRADRSRAVRSRLETSSSMRGTLLHCMEKPSQQILGYAAPRAMAKSHGAMPGQDFWGAGAGEEVCYVAATQLPKKGSDSGAFWVWVLPVSSAKPNSTASCPTQD